MNQETGTEPGVEEQSTLVPAASIEPEAAEPLPIEAAAEQAVAEQATVGEAVPAEPVAVEPAAVEPAAVEPVTLAEDPTPPDVPPTEVAPAAPADAAPSEAAPSEAAPSDAPAPEQDAPAEIPTPADTAEVLRARFDAAAGELGTLAGRIAADELPFKAANAELDRIKTVAAAGGTVPETLKPHLDAVEALLAEKAAAARAARAEATAAARAIKDRIVAEAEELAGGEQWRVGGQRLTELLEEWKACARLDRKSDDVLWKRFSSARSTFTKRRKAHYATLTAERDGVKSTKQSLVEQAEALADSTQWAATAARFRDLMTEWKGAGRAGKEIDDELWERFRAAQDAFFTARKNAAPAPPRREAGGGAGPRGPRPDRDRRPAAVQAPQPSRTNPAAIARAQETVEKLRALIESFETKAAKASAAGDAKAAATHKEAAEARREWLVEAEKTLAELS
ncbi:MAG: DUF349 domain-containing protein [Sporichthyaceae bacterium]